MTPGTGKRSYRACLRCRQRKTRCDLDKVGEPMKAPCASCHVSGSDCVLIKSRRGGNFRRRQKSGVASSNATPTPAAAATATTTREIFDPPVGRSCGTSSAAECPSDGEDSAAEESGDVLNMELRNPSDALQILALSGENQRGEPRQLPGVSGSISDSNMSGSGCRGLNPVGYTRSADTHQSKGPTTIFDDYELVQRGLIRPGVVYELLHRYSHYYHPYCPIVPSYFLSSSNTEKIQRTDYFLLTAILTIASRDDARHSLTHRYCWDHAQRLLIDVLLSHPWTQTPRTVEGLLLLAEWLPHIQVQETASEASKNLFSEDRTAWSLVGLAVRHGYLQRLDQGAFRSNTSNITKERAERNRLVWAYIWIADRQISVRMGQSFWSRGPSNGARFVAQDFPSLQPRLETNNEDYASVLQGTTELIQILHNAHAILYASKDRTLAMIYDGQYSRYLDDFRAAARTWHSAWSNIAVSSKVQTTLLIMYEYICLYTNAFSFQAVITRAASAADPRLSSHKEQQQQQSRKPFAELLSHGIMSSPDGRFIFDAFSAARNLLSLMNSLDPQTVLCYLPSRYYLYGVYAAVLLHKADCAGAFHLGNQRDEIISLVRDFISVLEKAPSTESHICHSYSRMLKQLWTRRERRHSKSARRRGQAAEINTVLQNQQQQQRHFQNEQHDQHDQQSPAGTSISNSHSHSNSTPEDFTLQHLFDPVGVDSNDLAAFPSIEGYFQGSFMPGVADFSSPFDGGLDAQGGGGILPGIQDWDLGQAGLDPAGGL